MVQWLNRWTAESYLASSNSSRAITITFGQIPWERYEPPYPPSYGLNSITDDFLERWFWLSVTQEGCAISQWNLTRKKHFFLIQEF